MIVGVCLAQIFSTKKPELNRNSRTFFNAALDDIVEGMALQNGGFYVVSSLQSAPSYQSAKSHKM